MREQLSKEEISILAPATQTTQASPDTSNRYALFNTIDATNALENADWVPIAASQSKARDPLRRPFAKHMILYRQKDNINGEICGDLIPEVIKYNSHDGKSSLQILGGLYSKSIGHRIAIGDAAMTCNRFRHHISKSDGIYDAVSTFGDRFEELTKVIDTYKNTIIDNNIAITMAGMVHSHILNPKSKVTRDQLLGSFDDIPNNLWDTFNMIWTKIYCGGIPVRQSNGKIRKTKKLTSPVSYIKLSRKMWIILDIIYASIPKHAKI